MDTHEFDEIAVVPPTFRPGLYRNALEKWKDERRLNADRRADAVHSEELAHLRNTLRRQTDRDMDTFLNESGRTTENK